MICRSADRARGASAACGSAGTGLGFFEWAFLRQFRPWRHRPGPRALASAPSRRHADCMTSKPSAEQQATVEGLLQAAKRPTGRVNVRHSFVRGGS